MSERFTLVQIEPGSAAGSLAAAVRDGLSATPKRLPCRFFYDEAGSRLFEQICELPEYYVTRAERAILEAHAGEIAAHLPAGISLVELGSGSAEKTRLLIDAALRRQATLSYVPVDISRSALEASTRGLLGAFPGLRVAAVAAEYEDGLRALAARDLLQEETGRPKLILWLGSNIGNLRRDEAAAFLRRVGETMSPADRLLVGIDLRKDRSVLEPAYDDAQGVTAQFNKNLLVRINHDLGGHFDLDSFVHRAVYHEVEGRIAMYLDSTRDQVVPIEALDLRVAFAAGESIHTEDSYKYGEGEIRALAEASGLALERQWYDTERRFSETLLRLQTSR